MVPSNALLSLVLIALTAVDASPASRRTGKATLSFATKINKRGTLNVVEQDRARAQSMKQPGQLGKRSPPSFTTAMIATVGVGAGTYSLLVDTGSSNTWVGAGQPYQPGPNSQDTGETVQVSDGSASFSGEEFLDDVTVSGMTIQGQSIGVASSATGFNGLDGVLGLGPTGLTQGTTSGGGEIPTVVDNLFSQGTIGAPILGVSFVPTTETSQNEELTFGGIDTSAIVGSVSYVPLTTTSPASTFWGIDQSISYGGTTILSETAGIVDTGTTLLLIATDAFQTYQSLTGGTPDSATGLLSITSDQYTNLQSLLFTIGGTSYELTANAQIWPRSLNTAIGGSSSAIYLVVADIGTPSGSGLDFTNGYTFLQRFYSVYDTGNTRVGFAETPHTYDTTN